MKISNNGLDVYFEHVIISEVVGVNKPDRAIFDHALNLAEADVSESIMIGDSIEADIRGAQDYGMKAIYFNPQGKEKPVDVELQINCLSELIRIL
jgi:putative hydrolase of the HAD superfamily